MAILCGLASLYALWSGGLGSWVAGAGGAIVLCLLLLGPLGTAATAPMRRLVPVAASDGRIARFRRTLAASGLFEARLARRLFAISVVRFILLWLMAVASKEAVGLDISNLQLAATLPLVILASILVVTPANIGVNEGACRRAHGLGVDLETAAQFALVNRALVLVAALTMVPPARS